MNTRMIAVLLLAALLASMLACSSRPNSALTPAPDAEAEARTEFTDRIENFFEYEPLKAGRPSQFLIHLTDLSDGSPVDKAEVTLTAQRQGGAPERITARVGKVTGLYVADVKLAQAGMYDIEFRVKNARLDERMPLTGFKVE